MMKKDFLKVTLFSTLLLGALHHLGSVFFLYWTISWFDILMHFLGGFTVGAIFIWGVYGLHLFGVRRIVSAKSLLITTTLFVIVIGIGWEAFEHVYNIANPTGGNYFTDTSSDIIADILGGLAVTLIAIKNKVYA